LALQGYFRLAFVLRFFLKGAPHLLLVALEGIFLGFLGTEGNVPISRILVEGPLAMGALNVGRVLKRHGSSPCIGVEF